MEMEFIVGAGAGLLVGMFVDRVFGNNFVADIKNFIEKLVQGVEVRIKQDNAELKATVEKKA
jgi:outer membrane lipoprotein SlyB